MNNLTIDIEHEDQSLIAQSIYKAVSSEQITAWLQSVLNQLLTKISLSPQDFPALALSIFKSFSLFYVSIIFVESEKSQVLNNTYRKKNKPTNILSFPSSIPIEFYQTLPKEEQEFTLGDLVVDLSVIQQEAQEQHKKLDHHLAHIMVHGLLHLLGFDHELTTDAIIMETLEIELLNQLGILNPYKSD